MIATVAACAPTVRPGTVVSSRGKARRGRRYDPAMARIIRRTEVTECRRCSRFCDRVIAPASCVAAACPALYEYTEPLSGRRYMGCMHKVFATEIDVELFKAAQRTKAGFGTVKLAGAPLGRCHFEVETAFIERLGETCVNRRFFDWPDASPDAVRAFDLRDRL
jgi:hypothetical protein